MSESELEKIIVNNMLNKLVETNKKGKKYILEEKLEKLNLTKADKNFLLYIMKKNKIELVRHSIKRNDRPAVEKEFNFGEITSNNLEQQDLPVKAQLEYTEDGILQYENYEELANFIENEFLPNHIIFVQKRKNEDQDRQFIGYNKSGTTKKYSGTRIPAIKLKDIVALRLSEKETKYIIEYLGKIGVTVRGTNSSIDGLFENYDYYQSYYNQPLPKSLSGEECQQKAIAYQKNKNSEIREQLIMGNLRLVPYVCWKYSLAYDKDIQEIESYGYEALIEAINDIDHYNPDKGTFVNYLINKIEYKIRTNKPIIFNMQKNNDWSALYLKAKENVEKKQGETVEDNAKLAQKILDEMLRIEEENMKINPNYNKLINISIAQNPSKGDKEYQKIYEQILKILIQSPISLEEYLKDDNWNQKEQIRNVDNIISSITPEEYVEQNELQKTISNLVGKLTERERFVINSLYGLTGESPKTYEQVGKEYGKQIGIKSGIRAERIRQIEMKALRKLRYQNRSVNLRDYRNKSESSIITNPISYSSSSINYSNPNNEQVYSDLPKKKR